MPLGWAADARIAMSTGIHKSRLREGQNEPSSRFGAVLLRIGRIRENSDWHRPKPSSTATTRRNRIFDARRNVIRRFTAYITAVRSSRQERRTRHRWIAVLMLIVLSVAVFVFRRPSQSVEFIREQFTFPLPRTETFLSEQDGITKAREALARVVRNPNAFVPIPSDPKSSTVAPDGSRDVYLLRFNAETGYIAFVESPRKETFMSMELTLRGDQLTCTVTGTRWK